MIEVDRALLYFGGGRGGGVVLSLRFDDVTLISLYISSYREATEAMFIHTNA